MKIFGRELKVRGSNKIHTILDDLDLLYEELLLYSMAEVAKKYNVPPNSIRHRVQKYFLPEMKEKIKRERRFHKNNTKGKIKISGENTNGHID